MTTSSAVSSIVREFDFFKIENDVNAALQQAANGTFHSKPISLASLPLPYNSLTEKTTKYAQQELDPSVFTHCLRTYYLGAAIATDGFKDWQWNPQTFYLISMLHDIKCSHKGFRESAISFQVYDGMVARDFLLQEGASKHESDTVMEAIWRHTDLETTSSGFSPEGQMLRFGAQLDVLGNYATLIHKETIRDVVKEYPRNNFNNVFADLLLEHARVKRYCSGAYILKPGGDDSIRHNAAMAPYDNL